MTTDTTERGLEQRVCALLTRRADAPDAAEVRERPATYDIGWINGHSDDYDREHCIDLAQLTAFLKATQPHLVAALALDADGTVRRKFLARLKNEVGKRGIVEVLRNGVKHGPHTIALLYGTPSPGNPQAVARYDQNRFSVTRQLSYSNANKRRTLDLALFINGLPVATFELKNSLTKQTAADAAEQYKRDRDPKEELFRLGRCLVHFAVDDLEVRFCTHLDSYRAEKQATLHILLPDEDAEIEPVPASRGGYQPEPAMDRLSNILREFNDLFGDIPWTSADRIRRMITEDVPQLVEADHAYRNARQHADAQNTRIEHDRAFFEELVRRFNEENNEEAGEHWTPHDAVKLMANLIFLPVADASRSISNGSAPPVQKWAKHRSPRPLSG